MFLCSVVKHRYRRFQSRNLNQVWAYQRLVLPIVCLELGVMPGLPALAAAAGFTVVVVLAYGLCLSNGLPAMAPPFWKDEGGLAMMLRPLPCNCDCPCNLPPFNLLSGALAGADRMFPPVP